MQSIKNFFRDKRVHQGSINNNSVCYMSAAVYKFLYQMLISAILYIRRISICTDQLPSSKIMLMRVQDAQTRSGNCVQS